jgi:undecaprenyl-diphosphatase
MSGSADLALFHLINGLAGHRQWLDLLMVAFAKYAPAFYAIVLLGCWLTWRPRWQRMAAIAGGAALVALGVGQLVGAALPRARPYLVTTATVLVPHAPDTSFPSDHAILVVAVTIVLTALNRRLGAWLAAAGVVVLFSRVYIGVHYPTDVVGGAVIGAIGGWAALWAASTPVVRKWIDAAFRFLCRLHVAARPDETESRVT